MTMFTEPSSSPFASAPRGLPKAWVTVRNQVAMAAPALLFVPMFLVTITTLYAPAPWRAVGSGIWGALVTWVMTWIVLPFAVGAWRRQWLWPLLCLGTTLATAWFWNGGQALIGPHDSSLRQQEPLATVSVFPQDEGVGGLAAVLAALGVVLADPVRRLDPVVLRLGIVIEPVVAIVPVVVAWVVVMFGPGRDDTPFLRLVSLATLLAASTVGPFVAALWIRRWWWVPVCLLAPSAVVRAWALPYLEGLPILDPYQGWAHYFMVILSVFASVVAAVLAAVGVIVVRWRDPVGGQWTIPGWIAPWARWLAGTVVVVLVCYHGVGFVTDRLFGQATIPSLLVPGLLVVSLLIGLRRQTRWRKTGSSPFGQSSPFAERANCDGR